MAEIETVDVDEKAFQIMMKLNSEWGKSFGRIQEEDSLLLKAFKNFKLAIPVTDDRGAIYLPSANDIAPYLEKQKNDEPPPVEWIEAAVIAHNRFVAKNNPSNAQYIKQLLDVNDSPQAQWSPVVLIQDTIYHVSLSAFCRQEAQAIQS